MIYSSHHASRSVTSEAKSGLSNHVMTALNRAATLKDLLPRSNHKGMWSE
jgi:hypothetical protein